MSRIKLGRYLCLAILISSVAHSGCQAPARPEGFVQIKDVIPNISYEIRYYGSNNFLGRPVKGYEAPSAFLSKEATAALKAVQKDLNAKGFGLKIFDAYRPQRAVDDFVQWARNLADTVNKRSYYPDVPKSELFKRGYIASKSGHTRGSTLDLTIIDLSTGKELDMGGPYDFFGEISHHNTTRITKTQQQNRTLLKSTIVKYGFLPYSQEWWHYTLKDEPYPETYFDFPVTER
jgi:D-alanyl-D-alanine dipeptidase